MNKISIIEQYSNVIEQNLISAGFDITRKFQYSNCKSGNKNIFRINTIYVDNKKKNVAFVKVFFSGIFKSKKNLTSKVKVCSYKDVNGFELKEDGQTVISGNSGSTLIGGALLGNIGALAGASGKRIATKQCTRTDLNIYINDLNEPVLTFNIFDLYVSNNINKDYVVYEMIGLLTYIKKQAENAMNVPFDINKFTEITNHSVCNTQTNKNGLVEKNSNASIPNKRDKWITFIFCILFGSIGLHKFYEKKLGLGILYIFTCGIFGIGIIVDLVKILLKKERFYTIS